MAILSLCHKVANVRNNSPLMFILPISVKNIILIDKVSSTTKTPNYILKSDLTPNAVNMAGEIS